MGLILPGWVCGSGQGRWCWVLLLFAMVLSALYGGSLAGAWFSPFFVGEITHELGQGLFHVCLPAGVAGVPLRGLGRVR